MRRLLFSALLVTASCKVPITDIQASFSLADATWFEEEQTLFFFYRAQAQQGIGEDTSIEVTWTTDDHFQDWTELSTLPQVHTHLPVDCGPNGMCGSGSVKVDKVPRFVNIRLRYHRQGALFLQPAPVFNVVGIGPSHTNRSLLVYGVFDQTNTRVQWRARNNFPTLRNEEVTGLGLRRLFRVLDPAAGEVTLPMDNPYGYAFDAACPAGLQALGWTEATTNERATFAIETLPLSASTAPALCARSIVTDALGTFERPAIARKNPETRPAFPLLRSPIKDNRSIGFVLRPCNKDISRQHLDMQIQRLQLSGAPEICIDDIAAPGFATQLAGRFRTRIDTERMQGQDMVLVIALHHDDETGPTRGVVEEALEAVLPSERDKTSPRVSGAFVFDSYAYKLTRAPNKRVVLWCPGKLPPMVPTDDLDLIPQQAQRDCPLLPDLPDIIIGPFSFGTIPILPTRAQYTTFVSKYSEAQAGSVTKLQFRAPERTPVSQNIPVGEFGVATFFNHESFPAAPTDAFSFCAGGEPWTNLVVFRVPIAPEMPGPLQVQPEVHEMFPQPRYELGLGWDFPFLTRLEYQVTLAGSASAFSVTVPFGVSGQNMQYFGQQLWQTGEFKTDKLLTQCTRFCDNPTFDSAGVYNVQTTFRDGFKMACYTPAFPALDSGGFPVDP